MIQTIIRASAIFVFTVSFCGVGWTQGSGVVGDGIPDFYYFPADGLTALTSFGPITRPAGVMTLDTDGSEGLMAFFVTGAEPVGLPQGFSLPRGISLFPSTWTAGSSGNTSEWIQGSPISGPGFQGVIGTGFIDENGVEQGWPESPPFVDYPEFGFADYGPGLTQIDFAGVAWGTDSGFAGTTEVTIVPEPTSVMLYIIGLLAIRRSFS